MEQKEELVLVTANKPTLHYSNGDYIHLARGGSDSWKDEVMCSASFVDRWMAEQDNTILQLIPYVLVFCPQLKVFSYKRRAAGDQRLEGRSSVGIGGHVNPIDKRKGFGWKNNQTHIGWDTVTQGAVREVSEELALETSFIRRNLLQIGTIYTPATVGAQEKSRPGPAVGEVHLGILYCLRVPSQEIKVREEDQIIDYKFVTKPENVAKYERWSQLAILNLDNIRSSIEEQRNP